MTPGEIFNSFLLFATALIGVMNLRQLRATARKTEADSAKTEAETVEIRAKATETLERLSVQSLDRLAKQLQAADRELVRLRGEVARMEKVLENVREQYEAEIENQRIGYVAELKKRDDEIAVLKGRVSHLEAGGHLLHSQLVAAGINPLYDMR